MGKILAIVIELLGSKTVQDTIVALLKSLSTKTTNTVDDKIVMFIENSLKNEKDVETLKEIYTKWSDEGTPSEDKSSDEVKDNQDIG